MWLVVQLIMCAFLAYVVKSSAFVSAHRRGLSPAMSTARQLAVGDRAPDFELKNAKGQSFRLSDYLGKKSVVVFFYPADNSPGCTQQVCAFQRKFPDFRAANAEVFGVSNGGVADKEKFIASNGVTSYELLIDEGDKLRKAWKVPRALFGKPFCPVETSSSDEATCSACPLSRSHPRSSDVRGRPGGQSRRDLRRFGAGSAAHRQGPRRSPSCSQNEAVNSRCQYYPPQSIGSASSIVNKPREKIT